MGRWFEPIQGQVSSLISPHYPRRLLGPVYPKQCAQKRPKTPSFHFIPRHDLTVTLRHVRCPIIGKCSNSQPKQLTMSIFCDLSKAFDVISHNILLQKLEFYGLRGVAKEWISNYLSDRHQYVEIENFKSSVCKIECGVPQGSILGPLLYLIYVNDIPKATTGNLLSFADDTSLYLSHSDVDILFQNANTEMNNLYEWFCANRLSLNAKKNNIYCYKSTQPSM